MKNPPVPGQQPSSRSPQAAPLAKPAPAGTRESANAVSEQQVRTYAYELYERRGGTENHAVEDWLAAETHLAARNREN